MFNESYIGIINDTIQNHLNDFLKETPIIKKLCEHVLLNGKRIRPCITIDICNTLSNCEYSNYLASLSVEYIHTASLIVDDLPCMDNAKTRRKQTCIHLKYGEASAQIASVTLLSLAINSLFKNILTMKENNITNEQHILEINTYIMKEFSNVLYNTSHGQLMDLNKLLNSCNLKEHSNENLQTLLSNGNGNDNDDIITIIKKKTGSFFEMSFIIGYLFGKGDISKIDKIKDLSFHFSMIYQILDDIEDMEEDLINNKRNTYINYALHFGMYKTMYDFKKHFISFNKLLNQLNLNSVFFIDLTNHLKDKFDFLTFN